MTEAEKALDIIPNLFGKLHTLPAMEKELGVPDDHAIVDRGDLP